MVARVVQESSDPGQQHSQRLLGTLLGDYWFWRTEHLPSAALVEMLGEFGLAEPAARAAIRRAAARGLVVASRAGRTTAYGVPERTRELVIRHVTRLMRFGAGDRSWDGRWTFALFSVPEEQREVRRTLRTRLRWLGWAPLYDGVWVTPWDVGDQALDVLAELGIDTATVARAELAERLPAGGHPLRAWDLDALRARYEEFLDRYRGLAERVRAGEVGPAEALTSRTRLMTHWREFPDLDPELPAEVLPADWPRAAARECFVTIYDGLGPLAERRFAELLARHAPDLAPLAAHRTSEDVRRGEPPDGPAPSGDARTGWIGPLGRQ